MDSKPHVATMVVIFAVIEQALQVLLVQRTAEPERGCWALPGGRWDGDEPLDATATRKLREETGAGGLYLEQLFTSSGLDSLEVGVAVAYFAVAGVLYGCARQTAPAPAVTPVATPIEATD